MADQTHLERGHLLQGRRPVQSPWKGLQPQWWFRLPEWKQQEERLGGLAPHSTLRHSARPPSAPLQDQTLRRHLSPDQ